MTHPERLGKYVISGVLGNGAMGVVYTGFDPDIRRPVALKTIHKKLIDDEAQMASITARFRNEAQAVGRLQHPGIVAIYEFGEDASTAYIAMELVKGRNLAQVLAAHTVLSEQAVLRAMDQLLDALDCAHRHGVWHRDIKPANLILTDAGQLKVTDFGIARIENLALTSTDSVIGTPGYMAPEQYSGKGVDHRADIFACGVLLYRLLGGEVPFAGTYESVMYKILHEQPPAPSRLQGGAGLARYDDVVARALAKDPRDRYQSAKDFSDALADAAAGAAGDMSDTTIILPPGRAGHAAAPGSGDHGGHASSGAHAPVTGWDSLALAQIERSLATHLGPMARLLVRQAARSAKDLHGISRVLSEHIADASARADFITKANAVATSLGGGARTHPSQSRVASTGGSVPGSNVTTLASEHALHVLTKHIGPIAKIVVRKALARSASNEQFFLLLVEEAGLGEDPAKLLEELRHHGR